MRPHPRSNGWLCIVSSVALVMSGLSSPIRAPQAPNSRVCPNFLSRNFALVTKGAKPTILAATADWVAIDADGSDFDEENEEKSSWTFFHLATPTSFLTASPHSILSRPRPGNSPPRAAAVPLRC